MHRKAFGVTCSHILMVVNQFQHQSQIPQWIYVQHAQINICVLVKPCRSRYADGLHEYFYNKLFFFSLLFTSVAWFCLYHGGALFFSSLSSKWFICGQVTNMQKSWFFSAYLVVCTLVCRRQQLLATERSKVNDENYHAVRKRKYAHAPTTFTHW